ncbi:MAG: hypothetical protein M3354_01275, partial [Chloroflexota bacterium]|nr:hypothetical protein [Chloroflexota bacterium]
MPWLPGSLRSGSRGTAPWLPPRQRRASFVGLLLLVMVVSVPHAGLAQEEEEEGNRITIDASQVLMPDPDLVSGSSWLVTTGQDPRFGAMRPNREMVTNAGWDAIDAAPGNPSGVAFAPLVPFRSAAPAFSRNIIITRQLGL